MFNKKKIIICFEWFHEILNTCQISWTFLFLQNLYLEKQQQKKEYEYRK
jgi:hypothetical protein